MEKTPPLENMCTNTCSWSLVFSSDEEDEVKKAWRAWTAGARRASCAFLPDRVMKSFEELRMMMIRAVGARRVYSVTYLDRARGGAFIQNARMMVLGAPLLSDCDWGSWI